MTNAGNLTPLELHAMSDRELLIMVAGKQNEMCQTVNSISEWKNGNGTPGAQFQLRVLWLCFVAVVAKMWSGK